MVKSVSSSLHIYRYLSLLLIVSLSPPYTISSIKKILPRRHYTMQQKEIQPDWRILEDLATAKKHHHCYQRPLSISDFLGPRDYQHWPLNGLHDSNARSHCGLHGAQFSLSRPYSKQHASRRSKKHPSLTSRTPHILCTPLASHASFRTSRAYRSTVAPELFAPQRHTKLQTQNRANRELCVKSNSPCLPWPSSPSMQRNSPSTDRSAQDIRAIVSSFVPPHESIRTVQLLPYQRLQQVYEVKLSDMTTMLVVLPPPSILRLLRLEQNVTQSEAAVVRWLRDELLTPTSAVTSDACCLHRPKRFSTKDPAIRQSMPSTCQDRKSRSRSLSISMLRGDLIHCLPSPVTLHRQTEPTDIADSVKFEPQIPSTSVTTLTRSLLSSTTASLLTFNVFRPPPGAPIAALATPLTAAERASIDYQAGKLVRNLSKFTSKSGHFGPALTVLAPQLGEAQAKDLPIGMTSWSVAFHSILESILRDGEDVAVTLAYSTIRKHFQRLGYLLDSVTIPHLVVVDAMDEANLLVQRNPALSRPTDSERKDDTDDCSTASSTTLGQQSASPTSSTGQEDSRAVVVQSNSSPPQVSRSASLPAVVESPADIVVTGLRDWSHCVFGDPLFASVFSEQPSTPFLGGYASADRCCEQTVHDLCSCQDERENRAIRILLYQCYHAVVQVVRGFYRPGRDHTTQELAARKRLTGILAKLEAIDDDPKQRFRHRRPSGEVSPAKKPKAESEDEASK